MSDYAEVGLEFLEHYGKKGMKWGQRNSSRGGTASIKAKPTAKGDLARASLGGVVFAPKSSARTAQRVINKTKKKDKSPTEATIESTLSRSGKAKIKTEGGKRQPASEDALKAAGQKQKLKKSGVDALSNKELQDLSTRMNLEVQVSRLNEQQSSSGKKFVKKLVEPPKPQEVRRLAIDNAKKQQKK